MVFINKRNLMLLFFACLFCLDVGTLDITDLYLLDWPVFAIEQIMPRLASDDSVHIVTSNVDAFVSLSEIFGVYKQCYAKCETQEEINEFLAKIETISKNFLYKYIFIYPMKPSDYVLRIGLEWWQLMAWNLEESDDNETIGVLGTNGPESLHKTLGKLWTRFNNFKVKPDEKNCFEPMVRQHTFYLWAGQETGFLSILSNHSRNEKNSQLLQGSGIKVVSTVLDWPYDCGRYFAELRDIDYKETELPQHTHQYVTKFKGIEKLDMNELESILESKMEEDIIANYNQSNEALFEELQNDEERMRHVGSVLAHGAPSPELPQRIHFVRRNSELNNAFQEIAP